MSAPQRASPDWRRASMETKDMLDTTALRMAQSVAPTEYWRFEGFTLDVPGRVLSDPCGHEIPLTRSEFDLLRAFVANPGRVLSRGQLLEAVAGRRAEPYDRSIDVLVARLRRKIEAKPKAPRLIVTLPGVGYKFTLRPGLVPVPDTADQSATAPDATSPPSPASSRHQVTILRCAITGAEALAAALEPEQLQQVVATFHACCTDVVQRFGGIVAKSDDAGMVAWFGYPQTSELAAERAMHAALALSAAVPRLGTVHAPPIHPEIGITTGLVLIGDLPDGGSRQDQGRPAEALASLGQIRTN